MADVDQAELDAFVPPYMSFETLRAFLERLDPVVLPPRIDRSMMVGMAGGTQTLLIQALRTFGLISKTNEVQPELVALIGDDEGLAPGMRRILEKYYAPQIELSRQQGTAAQLSESFASSGYSGSTLRKAVTFFLKAARAADIPVSPHFRAPAARPSTARPRRNTRTQPRPNLVAEASSQAKQSDPAESYTIQLSSGGSVTLSCSTTFISLSRADRDFVFGLVDDLRDYDLANGASAGDGAEG